MRILRWVLGLALAGLLLFSIRAFLRRSHAGVGVPEGPRVLLLVEEDPSLAPALRVGLDLLLRDHLETQGVCTLLPWPAEGDAALGRLEKVQALHLKLHPRREGQSLGLRLAWAYHRNGPWHEAAREAGPPLASVAWLGSALPLSLGQPTERLAPEKASAFWELVEAMGLMRMNAQDQRALALAQNLVRQSPGCATAHVTLALTTLRSGVQEAERQALVLDQLEEALRCVPNHPRISYVSASILVEMGRHREALERLEGAVRAHPGLPDPLQGVVYAARTSGLLELAGRAHRAQESLLLGPPPRLPLLVLLYRWEPGAFERHCRKHLATRPTVAHFYLGYLALARGQETQARSEMALACAPVTPGWEDMGELARIWGLHLDARHAEAMAALQALDQRRAADRAPDGEFTFMLAEAHDLLGDPEGALDQAHRALAQGFACTRWYQRSPFLSAARQLPRWKALEAHLQERQRLLEERFPPEAFGL